MKRNMSRATDRAATENASDATGQRDIFTECCNPCLVLFGFRKSHIDGGGADDDAIGLSSSAQVQLRNQGNQDLKVPAKLVVPPRPVRRNSSSRNSQHSLDERLEFQANDKHIESQKSTNIPKSQGKMPGEDAFVEVSLDEPEVSISELNSPVSGASQDESSARIHAQVLEYLNQAILCPPEKEAALGMTNERNHTSAPSSVAAVNSDDEDEQNRAQFDFSECEDGQDTVILPNATDETRNDDVPSKNINLLHATLSRPMIRAPRRLPSRKSTEAEETDVKLFAQVGHGAPIQEEREKEEQEEDKGLEDEGGKVCNIDEKQLTIKRNLVNFDEKPSSAIEAQVAKPHRASEMDDDSATSQDRDVGEEVIWQQLKDAKSGRYYYYNGKESVWSKPPGFDRQALLQAKRERKDGIADWAEAKDEHGRVYWFDKITMQSRWDRPPSVCLSAVVASSPRGSLRRMATGQSLDTGSTFGGWAGANDQEEEEKHQGHSEESVQKKTLALPKSPRALAYAAGSRAKRAKNRLEHLGGGLCGSSKQHAPA